MTAAFFGDPNFKDYNMEDSVAANDVDVSTRGSFKVKCFKGYQIPIILSDRLSKPPQKSRDEKAFRLKRENGNAHANKNECGVAIRLINEVLHTKYTAACLEHYSASALMTGVTTRSNEEAVQREDCGGAAGKDTGAAARNNC